MAGWFTKLMQQGHGWGGAEPDAGTHADARDARHDAIVQALRERAVHDRDAREKRQRWYRQSVTADVAPASMSSNPSPLVRLHKFSTKVPCRLTSEARALLDEMARQFGGATVAFSQDGSGRQRLMLTRRPGAEQKQIGWLEQCPHAEPTLGDAHHQGLVVDTDGTMLVLRFHYPVTAVRMSTSLRGATPPDIGFAEIRPALDPRPSDRGSSPRLVWVTRPEAEAMSALGSRDYEAFYLRFKLELQAGIWSSLSTLLSSSPGSQWHRGSHYTVTRELDATSRRIHQTTVDDSGRAIDIGSDREYDAAPATDILLLYLDGDILADVADIYFTLENLRSPDAYFVKEELFTIIRRFWASSQSLTSCYGSDLAAVLRMAQRAVPMPAQTPLLKQDWTNLRQLLVDRYGEGGRKATALIAEDVHRPRVGTPAWPFASFPVGDVNVGLRVVYRQEWRCRDGRSPDVMDGVIEAVVHAMKWPVDLDGSLNTGAHALAPQTEAGVELQWRDAGRDASARLSEMTLRMACAATASPSEYDVVTRPAEIQNVVLVAERLPAPSEIDVDWIERHRRILTKVLLDESLRDALDTTERTSATTERVCEHVRANILHYQRAIWQQEDPQQRGMRYRKSGKKLPLEWRFELESGSALTIDDLADRLIATHVDGQFAAYSGGREVDLDQLIDPAGPVGYYGNYAIYHMRPEFGSGDLFSMLHFFKSPYLQADAGSGNARVENPLTIQEDAEEAERIEDAIGLVEAPEAYQLLLDAGADVAPIISHGHRALNGEWTIVAACEQRTLCLVATTAFPALMLARAHAQRTVRPGTPNEPAAARVLLSPDCGGLRLTALAGSAGSPSRDRTLLAPRDERPSLEMPRLTWKDHRLRAREGGATCLTTTSGAGRPHAGQPAILERVDEPRTPSLKVGRAHHPEPDSLIVAEQEAMTVGRLRTAAAHDSEVERVIFPRSDAGPALTAVSGSRATYAHQQVILSGDDDWLRPSLFTD